MQWGYENKCQTINHTQCANVFMKSSNGESWIFHIARKAGIIKLALQKCEKYQVCLKNYTPCCHTSQVIPQVQSDRRKWQWESKPFRLPLSFQTSNVFVSCLMFSQSVTNHQLPPISSHVIALWARNHHGRRRHGNARVTGRRASAQLPKWAPKHRGSRLNRWKHIPGERIGPQLHGFFRWLETLFWEVILLEVLIGIWSWKGNGGSHLWPSLGVSEIPTAVQIFMSGVGSLRTQSTQNTWWPWW